MRKPIKTKKSNRGYSLIELAITLIVVGILSVPAVHIYSLYSQNIRVENTEDSLARATSALGGFRSIHGRYPCPAAANTARGDLNYGYEDCTVSSPGIELALNSGGDRILVGTLPFREIGLAEEDAHDGHYNRLTYAVTEDLTDETTFNMSNGAIGIVDSDTGTPNSLISPPESAHFVILSHGINDQGAWTNAGVRTAACGSATVLEQENCDNDATFLKASRRDDFDDRVFYTTSIGLTHWQLSSVNENDIHMIRADNFTIGLDNGMTPTSMATVGMVDILNYTGTIDNASIRATGGVFQSDTLCDEDNPTNCFPPTAIYGLHADGQGIDCGTDFLVGIENTGTGFGVCSNEITFSCPPGEFFGGMNANGTLICDTKPLDPCLDATVTTTCGDTRTITGTFSGNYRYAYSGECYRSPLTNAEVISDVEYILATGSGTKTSFAGTTIAQGGIYTNVQTYIADVNAMARVAQDCGATAATAQVRDSFKCHNASWGPHSPYHPSHASEMAHERLENWYSFPSNPLTTSGYRPAEVSVAWTPTADLANTSAHHDCWCREDYRVTAPACSSGLSGNQVRIQKHRCPQTVHRWTTIHTNSTALCGCTQGPEGPNYYRQCIRYFNYPAYAPSDGTTLSKLQRLSGNVTRWRFRKCDASGNPYYDPNWQYDTSACTCHEVKQYSTVACPTGWSNSFTFNSTLYTNVAEVKAKTWQCPTGNGGNVSSLGEVGSWGAETTAHTEPCLCNPVTHEDRYSDCPSSLAGPPNAIHERRFWNCTTNNWGPWTTVSNSCYACLWTPPAGSGNIQSTAALKVVGDSCDCTVTSTASCYTPSGSDYEVWTGCVCSP